MRRTKLAIMAAVIILGLSGCTKEESKEPTLPPVEALEPTTAPEINDPISETKEALQAETIAPPVLIVEGEGGKAVEIPFGSTPEDIEDKTARENYEMAFEIEQSQEQEELDNSTKESIAEELENQTEITDEQYSEMEQDVKEFTDQQARELIEQVFGKQEE